MTTHIATAVIVSSTVGQPEIGIELFSILEPGLPLKRIYVRDRGPFVLGMLKEAFDQTGYPGGPVYDLVRQSGTAIFYSLFAED